MGNDEPGRTAARRRADQIMSPDYLEGVQGKPIGELRRMRAEVEQIEAEASFARRLLHGKLDILRAELARRTDGESSQGDLVSNLPSILADSSGSPGRPPRVLLPAAAVEQRRRVESLASSTLLSKLTEFDSEEIKKIEQRLQEAEQQVSAERKRIQGVLDVLRAELVRRYRSGEADPTVLLSPN